ncbi:lysine biosynthesis protein LysW [Candidatus Microgenomates bacterium]|nr:lysine biosynthesis protein LysW [Candidatus Microgenomates bacterium]
MTDIPKQLPKKAVCPECDTPFPGKDDLTVGKIIECPSCGTESEVISLSPLTLAPLEEEK